MNEKEKVKFPIGMLDEIPQVEQRKLLHRIVTLFFEDQVRISEEGDLIYSKTGLNKLKKILIDIMICADRSAVITNKKMGGIIGKAENQGRQEKSAKDRARAAGLITVEAQLPKPKKLIL